jgi:ribosomal protein L35
MQKLKSHSGGKKRFFITNTCKIIRKHCFRSHNLYKKSRSKKYFLSTTTNLKLANKNNFVYIN